MKVRIALVVLLATFVWRSAAADETEFQVIPEAVEKVAGADERPEGWYWALNVGGNLSYSHNRKVVGNPDGHSFQFGAVIESHAGYYARPHEWLTELSIKETVAKTATIDGFVKTADSFELGSTYFFYFDPPEWLGLFARVRLATALFPGWDIRDADTPYVRKYVNGDKEFGTFNAQEEIDLTDAFAPLSLKESLGLFALPIDRKAIKIRAQLGVGAQEVFTQSGWVIDGVDVLDPDDPNDPDPLARIQLTQLEDYQQVGGELEVGFSGAINEYVTWSVVTNLFQPFYSTLLAGKELGDLLEVRIDAKLSVRLASWLSLDYILAVRRIPLILDDWQVQNGVLLTAGFKLP